MRRETAILAGGTAAAVALTLAVGAAAAPERLGAVAAGALLGGAFQALVFALTAAVLPGKRLAAYGVGMVGRLLLVVLAALVVVPLAGVAPAPFLFALLAVLFATTLIEPVAHAAGTRKPTG